MFAIAIDGPAGAGKSTLAKNLAKELGFIYVDTGALYRTIAYYVSTNNINLDNHHDILKNLDNIDINLKFNDGKQSVLLNGIDVSEKIRTPEISMIASKVSAIAQVRAFLLDLQRNIAVENNVIMDGRDIATVILPNADVKIYLTASPEIRAKRRFDELRLKNTQVNFESILDDIKQRDYNDSNRKEAPLKIADSADVIDTDNLNEQQALEKILSIVKEKLS